MIELFSSVLRCRQCKTTLLISASGESLCCPSGHTYLFDRGCLIYGDFSKAPTELVVRDRQAHGYLKHAKFPTQIARVHHFLRGVGKPSGSEIALDLGCGPGPYTSMLASYGWNVLGIDISRTSLDINASHIYQPVSVAFAQADLNDFHAQPNSFGLLLMADFLQHLGDAEQRRIFLRRMFDCLQPEGWFYLSFFNINLKNRLKRDVIGSFCDGGIHYERLNPRDVEGMLPADVSVVKRYAMNISHDPRLDSWLSHLPYAHLFSRMYVLIGRKAVT